MENAAPHPKWSATLLRLERHTNGPRVYVLGKRIHEYQLGLSIVAGALVALALPAGTPWLETGLPGAGGLWLVVKDWPDLFPATRDTACWSWGVHRPPFKPWRRRAPAGL
jgi:hypothetical protein